MCADERDGDKDADPRNDEKDQRDDKDEPIRCMQGHLTPDLVCDCIIMGIPLFAEERIAFFRRRPR